MKISSHYALALKITFIIAFLSSVELKAQFKYGGKIEAGRLSYIGITIRGDGGSGPIPNQLPSRLKEANENGTEISAVNGFRFKQVLFVGVGVGYLNYGGAKGYSIYGDVEARTAKKDKLAALFGLRAGTSNLKGYKNTGTVELNTGISYKPIPQISFYLKGGVAFAYSASFVPLRFGIGF